MTDLDLIRHIGKVERQLQSVRSSAETVLDIERKRHAEAMDAVLRENRMLREMAYGMSVAMRVTDEARALEPPEPGFNPNCPDCGAHDFALHGAPCQQCGWSPGRAMSGGDQ